MGELCNHSPQLNELFAGWYPAVRRRLLARYRDPDLVEEAIQQAAAFRFLPWLAARGFPDPAPHYGLWVWMCDRAARDLLRKRSRDRRNRSLDTSAVEDRRAFPEPKAPGSVEDHLAGRDYVARLERFFLEFDGTRFTRALRKLARMQPCANLAEEYVFLAHVLWSRRRSGTDLDAQLNFLQVEVGLEGDPFYAAKYRVRQRWLRLEEKIVRHSGRRSAARNPVQFPPRRSGLRQDRAVSGSCSTYESAVAMSRCVSTPFATGPVAL
jgi:hypothetical protein